MIKFDAVDYVYCSIKQKWQVSFHAKCICKDILNGSMRCDPRWSNTDVGKCLHTEASARSQKTKHCGGKRLFTNNACPPPPPPQCFVFSGRIDASVFTCVSKCLSPCLWCSTISFFFHSFSLMLVILFTFSPFIIFPPLHLSLHKYHNCLFFNLSSFSKPVFTNSYNYNVRKLKHWCK